MTGEVNWFAARSQYQGLVVETRTPLIFQGCKGLAIWNFFNHLFKIRFPLLMSAQSRSLSLFARVTTLRTIHSSQMQQMVSKHSFSSFNTHLVKDVKHARRFGACNCWHRYRNNTIHQKASEETVRLCLAAASLCSWF